MREFFRRFAHNTSHAVGSVWSFLAAIGVVVLWLFSGQFFGYSDTWQLVINTGTTIVTFLMVFLIQNTQNRDTEALQVKLDELIRVTEGAHLVLLDLEELDDKQLDRIRDLYEQLAKQAREDSERGEEDTGTPKLNLDEGGSFEERNKAKPGKKR